MVDLAVMVVVDPGPVLGDEQVAELRAAVNSRDVPTVQEDLDLDGRRTKRTPAVSSFRRGAPIPGTPA